jgi:hypothetical protein
MRDEDEEQTLRRRVLAVLAGVALVGGLTISVPVLSNVGLLLMAGMTVLAAAVVAQLLFQKQRRVDWATHFKTPDSRRGADSRLDVMAQRIGQSDAGESQALTDLHALLASLADDRLLHRHGIDRRASPQAAEALLGGELTAYLKHPPAGRLPVDRLDSYVPTLEELS